VQIREQLRHVHLDVQAREEVNDAGALILGVAAQVDPFVKANLETGDRFTGSKNVETGSCKLLKLDRVSDTASRL
jgi:hypothetical protein